MKVAEAMTRWPDHEAALAHLELVRWAGEPDCPYCQSVHVAPHSAKGRKSPRWQCRECQASFSVTVGTVFHRTHLKLHKWFVAIVIVGANSKLSTAAHMARVLELPYKTAWSLFRRIRVTL